MTTEMKKLIAEYKAKNWRIEWTRKNHIMWFSPDGKSIVTASGTPSDWRVFRKLQSDLRRVENVHRR